MITICYLFTYAFEQFIAYMFFNNKFNLKKPRKLIIAFYALSFILQYLTSLFSIPNLNLLAFIILNALIVFLCFNISIKQLIFNITLLGSIMLVTEIIVMYFTTAVFNINLNDYSTNSTIMFLETAGSKTLYFFVAYLISKISVKEDKSSYKQELSYLLFILPASSIAVIISFAYLSVNLTVNNYINFMFICISLLLLLANVVVFLVHDRMIRISKNNTQLQLEKQRNQINTEYYAELEKQREVSNSLIHDIKRYLSTIRELSVANNSNEIISYIDSVYEGTKIETLRQYSNNKLVNIIVNRYANLCDTAGISLITDIRNINFSFISDSDLTTVLDNMLENAYEASKDSKEKFINLLIEQKNENFIVIKMSNSSDNAPIGKNGNYVTLKKDNTFHGIGLKSILSVLKKYNGNLETDYSTEKHVFSLTAIFQKIS